MVSNYISATQSTVTAIVLLAVPLLYIIVRKVLTHLSAPIRELPGPKSVSWLTGSFDRGVWEPDAQDVQLEWTRKYGPVFRYHGMFNVSVRHVPTPTNWTIICFQMPTILTTDLQALNYVLSAPEFEKRHADRQALKQFVGTG
jgi:hypothetical protein